MLSPKTIWISRRKPPEVSPKASVRPVVPMMMTADDLGDRAWTESRIRLQRLLPRHVGAGGKAAAGQSTGEARRSGEHRTQASLRLNERGYDGSPLE